MCIVILDGINSHQEDRKNIFARTSRTKTVRSPRRSDRKSFFEQSGRQLWPRYERPRQNALLAVSVGSDNTASVSRFVIQQQRWNLFSSVMPNWFLKRSLALCSVRQKGSPISGSFSSCKISCDEMRNPFGESSAISLQNRPARSNGMLSFRVRLAELQKYNTRNSCCSSKDWQCLVEWKKLPCRKRSIFEQESSGIFHAWWVQRKKRVW